MNGLTIHGLCLSNETPNAQMLPANLTGVTFIACNLDNVFIPPGNNLQNCSNRLFKVQNDGEDWLVDAQHNALQPLHPQQYIDLGLSVSPSALPAKPIGQSIIQQTQAAIANNETIALQTAVTAFQAEPINQQDQASIQTAQAGVLSL